MAEAARFTIIPLPPLGGRIIVEHCDDGSFVIFAPRSGRRLKALGSPRGNGAPIPGKTLGGQDRRARTLFVSIGTKRCGPAISYDLAGIQEVIVMT